MLSRNDKPPDIWDTLGFSGNVFANPTASSSALCPQESNPDSVDDLKSSCSVRGIRMPDFEVLHAKIAAALNRIIQNTRLKKKISLEEQKAQKEDRFLRERQIA